jgi:hypothetical protein
VRWAAAVVLALAAACGGSGSTGTDAGLDARRTDECPVQPPTAGAPCERSWWCAYFEPQPFDGLLIPSWSACRCSGSAWSCETGGATSACPPEKPVPRNDPVPDYDAGIESCAYYYSNEGWDFQQCTPCPPGSRYSNWHCDWLLDPQKDSGVGPYCSWAGQDAGSPPDAPVDQ